MAAKKFKIAATELKIGQNSPIHTPKLKFEAVVLTDCIFLVHNEKEGIPIWSFITWRTNKNPRWPLKIQNGCQRAQILQYFLLKPP